MAIEYSRKNKFIGGCGKDLALGDNSILQMSEC